MQGKTRKPYKGLPIEFGAVTETQIGPIVDVYVVMWKNGERELISIGRIGTNVTLPTPLYYATPTTYSPFTNKARHFDKRKDAAIYLLGVHDSKQDWMEYLRNNPEVGDIGMRHMF